MPTSFHAIASADPDEAHAILDMVEDNARYHLLRGHILVALIQTDDPEYRCTGIGRRSANWNVKEWLRTSRIS